VSVRVVRERIDVAKDGDHRRAGDEVLLIFAGDQLAPKGHLARILALKLGHLLQVGFETHLGSHNSGGIKIDLLVDIGHHPIGHQSLDNLNGAGFQESRQFTNREIGWELDFLYLFLGHVLGHVHLPFFPYPRH